MRTGTLILALGALQISGWAQPSAGVAGPVTGFVFDAPSGALRSMMGIPGAAYIGSGIVAGLAAASVAPDGSAALAVEPGGQLVLYGNLRGATPAALPVVGAIAGPDLFAWSGDSRTAAVYSARAGQAQILTALAPSPRAATAVDLSALPGKVTLLAFDGQRLILGVAGDSGGIYLSAPAGVQRIASAAGPSAIALAGSSLYFADNRSQQVFQIQNYAATPATVVFAADAAINAPAGLQLSADGQRLYVANAGNRILSVYDVASRSAVQTIDLNFVPTRLDRFGDSSVYLMNAGPKGPLYVVRDAGAGKAAAVFFVPVPVSRHPVKPPVRRS